jgi:hypothetical protein
LTAGGADEEESVADEDCLGAGAGVVGVESDDNGGVKVGEASGSVAPTAFLISGISLALFFTSIFSWMGVLSS